MRGLYVFAFGRPLMQPWNNMVLDLALGAKGFGNYQSCDPKDTGEEKFLRVLRRHHARWCIDVGANVGDYSRNLLRLTHAEVIAFEPHPTTFASLSKLQTEFPGRFTPVNKGLGDKDAELDLNFGEEDSTVASFSPEVNGIDYVGKVNKQRVRVDVVTLDSFLKGWQRPLPSELDLLKIDTEGYEFEVLLGARETLETRRPKFIQIEFNWHQLFKRQSLYSLASLLPNYSTYQLLPHGSVLNRVDPSRPENNIYHFSNFVFIRNDVRL